MGKILGKLRISKGMGQTELVRKIQLRGITMTRETLVKIERGVQHIYATQLKAIKELLDTSFDELLNRYHGNAWRGRSYDGVQSLSTNYWESDSNNK